MSGPPTSDYAGYVDPNFPNPGGPNDASVIIYGYAALYTRVLIFAAEHTLTAIGPRSPWASSAPFCLDSLSLATATVSFNTERGTFLPSRSAQPWK
jgi:hypothetical protein